MRAVPGGPRPTARLTRALGLDSNPLRRTSDRAEAWIRAGLLVVFLIAGPMAAVIVGQWTAATGDARASTHVTDGPHHSVFAGDAVLAAILAVVAVALALLVAMLLVHRFLNWRRLSAWEAAWRATEPRWTRHRS